LNPAYLEIRDEILREVTRVIDAQAFVLGPDVERLEALVRDYCGTRFAIGCASGSDALLLALLAAGAGPGDEVLTTPFTFFATAGAIVHAGARPVFVDIEPDTFNMDMRQVEDVLVRHPRVKAVIPVHLFGACADIDPLLELTRPRGVAVIEDAAQSIGAEYKQRRAGSLGAAACFSFYPSKNLSAFGDGGLLTTQDEGFASRLFALRVHGSSRKYHHQWVGLNSRLDALQAAVLAVKCRHLDAWTGLRQNNARLYLRLLDECRVPVTPPAPAPHTTRHVYNQFCIRAPRRDELRAWLAAQRIGTEIYYPVPLHRQPCFSYLGYDSGSFPESERAAAEILALPVYPGLPAAAVERVCASIAAFYRAGNQPD
jgi:dTDP-4-amino-4,6-dideoxygalactose transaminase